MTSGTPGQAPELPSPRALLTSTLIAAVVAAVLLVTVVLPAEYGVDPTRIGSALGLTQMGRIKMALAKEEAAHAAAEKAAATAGDPATGGAGFGPQAAIDVAAGRTDRTEITLSPGEGKEVKLVMRAGARANYSWTAEGGLVNVDLHAEPAVKMETNYHSYAKANGVGSDAGLLIAAFDGNHGWFWRNVGERPVVVTLESQGEYAEVKVME